MATNTLTAKKVERLTKPGRYHDGHGLHLIVTASGTKNWQLRYYRKGVSKNRQDLHSVEHWLGLGPLHTVSLKEARERARAARLQLLDGTDPIQQRKAAKAALALEAAKTLTFEDAAKQYYAQHERKWRNAKHSAQFLSSLKAYAFPVIGRLSVSAVDTGLVLKVLEPIWLTKTETASRVRARIESVLDWCAVRNYRSADIPNPARWKGHLSEVLPQPEKLAKPNHHAALPFVELPGFLTQLRARQAVAARALEFTILTAARTGETIGATWGEIDFDAKTWTVPSGRMKGGKEHKVPLAHAAIELLRALPREADNPFVFIGQQSGGGLSNMGMLALLKRMGQTTTVHGMRSCFSDWAHEQTSYPNFVIEMALAHTIANPTEAAYRRGTLLDKRRKLMEAWSSYCASGKPATGEVVPIRVAQ